MNLTPGIIPRESLNPDGAQPERFIQVSQPDEALEFLEQAKKANPNDARIMHGFALFYSMKNQFEDAAKSAKRSLELNPANTRVQMLLFTIYLESKTHLDEAEKIIASLESRGELDPQMVSQARQDLSKAKSGAGAGTKSTLDHGAKDPK